MEDFIIVSSVEGGDVTELDLEETGKLLLATLKSQFGPAVHGLRYKNPKTGNFRGVPVKEDKLLPPKGGWGDRLYLITSKGGSCAESIKEGKLIF